MKSSFIRCISIALVSALLFDSSAAAVAGGFSSPASSSSAFSCAARFEEQALSGRSVVSRNIILPFFHSIGGLLSDFLTLPAQIGLQVDGRGYLSFYGDPSFGSGGAGPTAPSSQPPEEESYPLRQPGELFLKIGAVASRFVPILGNRVVSRVRGFQALHDQLAGERSHLLTETVRLGFQKVASEIAGLPVEVFPNETTPEDGTTPVLEIRGGRLLIKEAAFVIRNKDVMAFLISYGQAHVWLQNHPRMERLFRTIPLLLRIRKKDTQLDFSAKLLSLFVFFSFWRLRNQITPLLRTPPITLDQILESASLTEDEIPLVRQAYRFAGRMYSDELRRDILFPSGKSVFAHTTAMARDVAELKQSGAVIAAALLSHIDPINYEPGVDLHRVARGQALAADLKVDVSKAREIQDLLSSFHRIIHTEHFHPADDPKPKLPSYRVQYGADRVLEVAESIAKTNGIDWVALMALWLAQKTETVTAFDPEKQKPQIDSFYQETIYTNAYLAERLLGSDRIPTQLENDVLCSAHPMAFDAANKAIRSALAMGHYQTQFELARGQDLLKQLIREAYGLPLSRIEFGSRDKTVARGYWKEIEEILEAQRPGKSEPRLIKDQSDLIGWRIVVPTSQQIETIRHSLPALVASKFGPLATARTVRRERHRGRVVMEKIDITYPHPYVAGHTLKAELQVATEEGKRIFLIGQSLEKFAIPHDQYKAKRHADNLTAVSISELDSFFYGQQFDHIDPRRRGVFDQDARAIRRPLRSWIHPAYSLDHKAMTASHLDTVTWEDNLKLPAKAIVADLVFHKDVGGHPDYFLAPYRITEVPDPAVPGNFLVKRVSVDLMDPLLPGDRIVFDPLLIRSEGPRARRELYDACTTARAKLALYPITPDAVNMDDLERTGRAIIGQAYGDLADPVLKDYALPAVLHWLGLTEAEFFQAVALSARLILKSKRRDRNQEVFQRVHDDFNAWYTQRFVKFDARIQESPGGDALEIVIGLDQNQIGLLDMIFQVIQSRGLTVLEYQRLSPTSAGGGQLRLLVERPESMERSEVQALSRDLLSLRRLRGEHRPIEDGERLAINVSLGDPSVVPAMTHRIAEMGISIESLTLDRSRKPSRRSSGGERVVLTREDTLDKLRGRPRSPRRDRSRSISRLSIDMVIVAPQAFKSFPGQSPVDVVAAELLKIDGIHSMTVSPADYSTATVEEIKAFLISRARRIDPQFRVFLPATLQLELALPPSTPQARGNIDEVAIARFKSFWSVVEDFHPAEDNNWATQNLRKNGAPYLAHPLSILWNVLDRTHVTGPVTIGLAAGHDLFEDGVQNVINKSGGRMLSEDAKAIIVERAEHTGPSYIVHPILRLIGEKFTRASHQTYKHFLKTIAQSGDVRQLIVKCYDAENNLVDPTDRRVVKALRYYLDFYSVISSHRDESLKIARGDLLRTILTNDTPLDRHSTYYDKREVSARARRDADREILKSLERFLNLADTEKGAATIRSETGLDDDAFLAALVRLDAFKNILAERVGPPSASQEGHRTVLSLALGGLSLLAGGHFDPFNMMAVSAMVGMAYGIHVLLHLMSGGQLLPLDGKNLYEKAVAWYTTGLREGTPENASPGKLAMFYLLPGASQIFTGVTLAILAGAGFMSNPLLIAFSAVNVVQGLTIFFGADHQGWEHLFLKKHFFRAA